MKDINECLMKAAGKGDEAGIKTLLLRSGCNAMSVDDDGWTALMLAAMDGHTSCVELLIKVSDVSAKDKRSMTASELARNRGHTSLAAFIDGYTLALSEMSELGFLVCPRLQALRHRVACSNRVRCGASLVLSKIPDKT